MAEDQRVRARKPVYVRTFVVPSSRTLSVTSPLAAIESSSWATGAPRRRGSLCSVYSTLARSRLPAGFES
jgi:hypothetical protein